MLTPDRRYDIDWLRVIAIGLLLIYHVAIGFQPWGLFIGFIQSSQPMESLWTPMAMLNVWRIPLLFFVSGMGVYFAIRKRNWKQLLMERSRRILLPFIFGVFIIVPIHIFIIQDYYNQTISYQPNADHLWFLGNIFIYIILLSPIFFYLKKVEQKQIGQKVKRLFASPLGLLLIIAGLMLEALLVRPMPFELYAMTWHGFFFGLLAFLFGFICMYSGNTFWKTILKWRWLYAGIGLILYLFRIFQFQFNAPSFLVVIESSVWIFAAFAFAYKYLNQPSKILAYLSQAAYPVYIIHMAVLSFASWLIFPLEIPIGVQLILVIALTVIGSIGLYELVIRRTNFLRPLFGLKNKSKSRISIAKTIPRDEILYKN